jgi:hypothetical protein
MKPAPLPPHGVIIYDGPSTLDGAPIVVVLTSLRGTSANSKTSGDGAGVLPLAQTYIIPRAMLAGMQAPPAGASKDERAAIKAANSRQWFANLAAGDDASACGACELRPSAVAAAKVAGIFAPDPCYVLNGPPDVAAAIVAGAYPVATLDEATAYVRAMLQRNRIAGVRGGSWGDPAAAPVAVHAALHEAIHADGQRRRVLHPDGRERRAVWTCYSRTWEYAPAVAADGWRGLAMASAHTPEEAQRAHARGWRPFAVVDRRRPVDVDAAVTLAGAIPSAHCPASNERGNTATCSTCGLCDGSREEDTRGAVTILSHGPANRSASACAANVAILARLDEARRERAAARRR